LTTKKAAAEAAESTAMAKRRAVDAAATAIAVVDNPPL